MSKYFLGSFMFSALGLLGCLGVGYYYNPTPAGAFQGLFIGAVLAVLEVSLSFDNAIVNAVILKKMTPAWRHRFLTWGILIAVFGMRLIFPLAIVSIFASVNPWDALVLAATQPDQYAKIMLDSHVQISAFGGMFLLMVTLKYFYDENKSLHWIPIIEKPASLAGKVEAIEIALGLSALLFITYFISDIHKLPFVIAGLFGLLVYLFVEGLSSLLEANENSVSDIHKASAALFIYLEVLDASFSFDGVVGAFAITNNLFIIMLGLSIGAFFVRSLTIYFVEKDTLTRFVFLEHGAFYAIGILALIMLLNPFMHIPEWVTGLIGAVVIAFAYSSSVKENKNSK